LFRGLLRIHERCPACALPFDSGEGAFLAPLCINYGLVAIVYVVPMLIAGFAGLLPLRFALAFALAGALALPALIYRASWSWWLMAYYLCLPGELPANRTGPADEGE